MVAGVAFGTRTLFAQTSARAAKPLPQTTPATTILTLADYEPLAKRRMSHMAYEYVAGGGGDEITLRENHLAFDRIRLQPRILQDVSIRVPRPARFLATAAALRPRCKRRLTEAAGGCVAGLVAIASFAIAPRDSPGTTGSRDAVRHQAGHHR